VRGDREKKVRLREVFPGELCGNTPLREGKRKKEKRKERKRKGKVKGAQVTEKKVTKQTPPTRAGSS